MAKKVLMQYQSIFFDLDHTLWDYETNSRETLQELYHHFKLLDRGIVTFDPFHKTFQSVNAELWVQYDTGKITSEVIRKQRFKQILEKLNAYEEDLSLKLSYEYLHTCPAKSNLMPDAMETLQYLAERYSLTIITNGFEEIQNIKLAAGGLHTYFNHIITAQKAGHRKPAREIFEYALQINKVDASAAMMVGDNLITDMGGARNASIANVFFNPDRIEHQENVDYEIINLKELCNFL